MREKSLGLGPLSVDEFLAFENNSPTRHEYVAGRVYAMSGTTSRHNAIAQNIQAALRAAARGGPCGVYIIDLKVRVPRDRIYYPDCVVVCNPHDGDTLVFDAPCLIVEVTSRSTRRIDRGEKLDAYLETPSLRGYLIAEHDRRYATLYTRSASGAWERDEVMGSGSLDVPCPVTTLSLDQVYEGVELPLRVREDAEDGDEWLEFAAIEEDEPFRPRR